MIKHACSILGAVILIGCGGGGSSDSSTSTAPQVAAQTISHQIQLGPVAGATVKVLAPDRVTVLFQGLTDQNGYFSFDPSAVRSAWEKLSPRPDFVWVISSGGVDTDPNDDGIKAPGEAVAVAGEVKGIVPIATLLNESNVRVSLLSSALADVLGNSNDLTETRIVDVANQLHFPDIDRDGKVTIRDVLFYEMGSGSQVETQLRTFYLDAVHKGDFAARQQYVSSIGIDLLPVRIESTPDGDTLRVKLFALNLSDSISYSFTAPNSSGILPNVYSKGAVISLSKGTVLYIRECNSTDRCAQTQVVSWAGQTPNSYVAAPDGLVGNVYQDKKYLDTLTADISKLNADFLQATQDIATKNSELNLADKAIADTSASILDIERQIAILSGN